MGASADVRRPQPTPASGSAAGSARRLDIQGLRAVAVLAVVMYHAGLPIPGGFVGVDVFFVISGFVITALLMRERAQHGRIRFGRFYLRRFKRLAPALALTVTVTVIASVFLLSPLGSQQTAAKTGIGAVLWVANLVISGTTGGYFDAPAETNPLLHTWSLSVEEQFYLVFPLLLAFSWRLASRRRGSAGSAQLIVAVVGLGSLALAILGSSGWRHPSPYVDAALGALLGFYSPLTRVWEFAAGALLALTWQRMTRMTRRRAVPTSVVGVLLLGASLFLISGSTPFPGLWTLLPVGGAILLLISGEQQDSPVTRVLSSTPMVKIGDWSYSIYLWHWPAIVFTKIIWPGATVAVMVAAALSWIPAYASYRWLEQPIRRLEMPTMARRALLIGGTVLPGIALSGLLMLGASNAFWLPSVAALKAQVTPLHQATLAGCHASGPLTQEAAQKCVWNASATGAPVYLVGDSHAEHWSEAVIGAGESLGRRVIIKTGASCPVVDLLVVRPNSTADVNRDCGDYVEGTTRYLSTAAPGLVILSAADTYWTSDTVSVGRTSGSLTNDRSAKLDLFRAALGRTVRTLNKAGHRVLLVQTRPRFTGPHSADPGACSLLKMAWTEGGCRESMPEAQAVASQGAVRDILADVARETGAGLVDPWTVLCADGICDTQHGSLVRYRDSNHVTVAQSKALAPTFEREMELASRSSR